ncbi:hypothetical protein APZ15_37100 [Burkholderia cepacia ATCC 25416]|nr:hypothetical protein APZ15_37100 [Burkholderia cepacia ATCC 25416]
MIAPSAWWPLDSGAHGRRAAAAGPADSVARRRVRQARVSRAAYAKTHKGAGSGARAAPCVGRSQPAWSLA